MTELNEFLSALLNYLLNGKLEPIHKECNIIRRHSKKLEELGDISFPLNLQNWFRLIDRNKLNQSKTETILDYGIGLSNIDQQFCLLKEESKKWPIQIEQIKQIKCDIHLFLNRTSSMALILPKILNQPFYSTKILHKKYKIKDIEEPVLNSDLTQLRAHLIAKLLNRIIEKCSDETLKGEVNFVTVTKTVEKGKSAIICGPVLDDSGGKNNSTTAGEFFKKRSCDMRMMAQHKYGVQLNPSANWLEYFEKLGNAAVTIELLSNKPQKSVKILLQDLSSTHKGASFIFYNCARLSAIFKEFNSRVSKGVYPPLPEVEKIDFSILKQPEEWELFYVYILQFPLTLDSVVDLDKAIFNPQNLIVYLSNLCSIFSVYYRRVRILTDPREHLFSLIHARLYLLKALQTVFHYVLDLLSIEPIKEM